MSSPAFTEPRTPPRTNERESHLNNDTPVRRLMAAMQSNTRAIASSVSRRQRANAQTISVANTVATVCTLRIPACIAWHTVELLCSTPQEPHPHRTSPRWSPRLAAASVRLMHTPFTLTPPYTSLMRHPHTHYNRESQWCRPTLTVCRTLTCLLRVRLCPSPSPSQGLEKSHSPSCGTCHLAPPCPPTCAPPTRC